MTCHNVYHVEMHISSAPELLPVDITILFSLGEGEFSPAGWNFGQTTEYNAEQTLRMRPRVIMPFISKDLEQNDKGCMVIP